MFNYARLLSYRTFNQNVGVCGYNGRFIVKTLRQKFPNLKSILGAHNFHSSALNTAKTFLDRENTYAFNIVTNINEYPQNLQFYKSTNTTDTNINTTEDFNAFMAQDFRSKSAAEIFDAFKKIANFCKLNAVDISDSRFDRLTDGLMDNVERLTDAQLFELLDLLPEFPECESFKSHNFHDIWSALDDICCWRLADWDRNTQFFVADKWYRLKLGKMCDYIHDFLDKLARKAKALTKNQLVHAFFFMNVCRRQTMDFEYEAAVERKIDEMSLDEIAVVALGYFKTQSKIKIPQVCSTMLRKAMDGQNVHEMTLSAIMKIIRLSSHPSISDQVHELLERLTPQLEKLSTVCLLHVALLGTTLQIAHPPSLKIAAQRIATRAGDVDDVRLKDVERILLPLSMFDYDPKTEPDIYQTALKEIHEERRRAEIEKYPRCAPSALLFLSIRGVYTYEFMDRILDKDFILQTYGKPSKMLPREIFSLDVSIDIECPGYEGNRLDPVIRRKSAKWLTSFTPTYDQKKKISKADQVILKAVDVVSSLCGGADYYRIEHVLPNFTRADIIICKDTKTNEFVPPRGLENYTLGDVMRSPKIDNLKWYAVVVIGWNNTIRDTSLPVGSINMKFRQLKKIGYTPVPIIWNEFMPLSIHDQKQYVLNKL